MYIIIILLLYIKNNNVNQNRLRLEILIIISDKFILNHSFKFDAIKKINIWNIIFIPSTDINREKFFIIDLLKYWLFNQI